MHGRHMEWMQSLQSSSWPLLQSTYRCAATAVATALNTDATSGEKTSDCCLLQGMRGLEATVERTVDRVLMLVYASAGKRPSSGTRRSSDTRSKWWHSGNQPHQRSGCCHPGSTSAGKPNSFSTPAPSTSPTLSVSSF
jgi:hypothetical protein